MTQAPAAVARSTVPSREPPSTTTTSLTFCASTALTTAAMAASSSRHGMTADTTAWRWTSGRGASLLRAMSLTGSGASRRRLTGQQGLAKVPIRGPVPDVPQGLLRRIAQSVVVVTVLRKRRDTARQRPAIGREIHQRPGPPAERPGRALVGSFQAQARLGRRARRAEGDAKRARQILGLPEIACLFACQALEQRLIRPCFADRRLAEEDKSLQIDFLDADFRRQPHECGQFHDRFLQARKPDRDLRLRMSLPVLQLAKGANIA